VLERFRAGDTAAFADLVTTYLARMTRFASHIVGSADVADDVVQAVFIELWNHRAEVDPARPLTPYLFRLVRNRALNERKGDMVRRRYQDRMVADAAAGAARAAVSSPEGPVLAAVTIAAALSQLSDHRQLALRLRIEEDLPPEAIGEVLGITPVAADRLVRRALAEVRDILVSGTRGG
jgi:RNA polymerase sigma-70 factor (ECF subfamily)